MKKIITILSIAVFTAAIITAQVKVNPATKTITKTPIAKTPIYKLCTSVKPPDKIIRPICTGCELGVSSDNLVSQTALMWESCKKLKVKIIGGTPTLRIKVFQYANEWSRYVNIKFDFVETSDADIIVTFGNDGKSWSYVGTDCLNHRNNPEGTTHFGWFDDNTPDDEFRRVIMHEFGHVLGFNHEQSHPAAGIPWDRELVYATYARNGWTRAEVDRNVFEESSRSQTQFPQYDPTSIMHYPVPEELTIGNFSVGWNRDLSETDKAFSRMLYPDCARLGNKLEVTIATGGDDLRTNSNARIELKFRNGPVRTASLELNKGKGWGNNSSNTITVAIPDGTSLVDIQECKLTFVSGKQYATDTPDNWNINRIKIDYVDRNGSRSNLAQSSGNPYVRFYTSGNAMLFSR